MIKYFTLCFDVFGVGESPNGKVCRGSGTRVVVVAGAVGRESTKKLSNLGGILSSVLKKNPSAVSRSRTGTGIVFEIKEQTTNPS